jgi:hypothetical protein
MGGRKWCEPDLSKPRSYLEIRSWSDFQASSTSMGSDPSRPIQNSTGLNSRLSGGWLVTVYIDAQPP